VAALVLNVLGLLDGVIEDSQTKAPGATKRFSFAQPVLASLPESTFRVSTSTEQERMPCVDSKAFAVAEVAIRGMKSPPSLLVGCSNPGGNVAFRYRAINLSAELGLDCGSP
jgi:hypothetical protein